ncbi:MAG TPA: fumarylacetoacetate hydrolase family protein [Candidatus Limnocylindrales bacterium]|nr:fumarylacetoacetate hydrolase family protein [Candidatus Limnocylindrales bacterium]
MKLCRFQLPTPRSGSQKPTHPTAHYGIVEREQVIEIREPFEEKEKTGATWPLADVKLLAPSEPSKIICVGRNYREHSAELGNDVPAEPLIFLKPPSAILAPGEPIVLTLQSERVDYEGELGIIIGRTCARLRNSDDVRPYILGYTCVNDVTARDLQQKDVQFTRAKSFDTFCPFGPVIETEFDPGHAAVETFVNGKKRQSGRVAEMIFPVDVIIRWISQVMTLLPGDLIPTGTPAGVGPLAAGDVVEVSVSAVGTLRNPVAAAR